MELFAGVFVADLAVSREWYERLLGAPPAFFPHDDEVVWTLDGFRHLYLLRDPARAGHGLVTVFLTEPGALDDRVAGIVGRGIEPARRETYDHGVRKVTFHDPDGSEIAFGG